MMNHMTFKLTTFSLRIITLPLSQIADPIDFFETLLFLAVLKLTRGKSYFKLALPRALWLRNETSKLCLFKLSTISPIINADY